MLDNRIRARFGPSRCCDTSQTLISSRPERGFVRAWSGTSVLDACHKLQLMSRPIKISNPSANRYNSIREIARIEKVGQREIADWLVGAIEQDASSLFRFLGKAGTTASVWRCSPSRRPSNVLARSTSREPGSTVNRPYGFRFYLRISCGLRASNESETSSGSFHG